MAAAAPTARAYVTGTRLSSAVATRDGSTHVPPPQMPRVSTNAIASLIEISRAQLRVDVGLALQCASAAVALATERHEHALVAQARRAKANALGTLGRNPEALALHREALDAFERAGNTAETARTLNATIQPLILCGRYEEALTAAERAAHLFTELGDDLRLARLEINIGNIFQRQDRLAESIQRYDIAHARLLRLNDPAGVFHALHNKAVALIATSDFPEALATYTAARDVCVAHGFDAGTAQADYNIAWLHYLRGEYSRAIDLLNAAAESAKATGDAHHGALCLMDLSEIYLELNLTSDAREMAEEAHRRFVDLGMGCERAKSLVNVAIACGQDHQSGRAIELFSQARRLLVDEQNQLWPSLIDLYTAVLLFGEGRLFEARRLASAALTFFTGANLARRAAICHVLLGRIDLRLGNVEGARRACESALGMADIAGAPLVVYHARMLLGQTRALAADTRAALHDYEAARLALETLRSRIRGDELKISFARNKVEVYELLVEAHLQQRDAASMDDAFLRIEQAKSRSLLDLIFQPVHAFARVTEGESELAREVRRLRGELHWYYHLVEAEETQAGAAVSPRIEGFRHEIGMRESQMARAIRDLTAADASQSGLETPDVASIDQIRAVLPPDAVLVEFFQTHDQYVVAVLDHSSLHVEPVTVESTVQTSLNRLRFQMGKFRFGASHVARFNAPMLDATRHHLHDLFKELLEPIWSQVRGRHLVIAPHGILHHVPFHALFDGREYVVDAGPVSYAPSGSIYGLCRRRPEAGSGGSLVMGIADAEAPQIEAEARAVAAALPSATLLLGQDASEEALRAHGARCRFIHIASHGYFRPESPMFSGIRLGGSYLNVYDLYQMRLPATLVALSGCATGMTTAAAGDELLGITRGLFSAGARTLLLTHWDVHDEGTAVFMGEFYERLVAGTPMATAAREAMLAVRAERPHPYYWAPFFLTGAADGG